VNSTASALDHVGVVVRDVAAARLAWEAAGFAPTPGGRIMLRQGYIEMLAQDAAKPSATLAAMLAQGEGAHVLTLRVADAEAAAARLARAGFAVQVVENSRPGEAGGIARFRRVPLADAAPRLQLIEHATPETVWHPALLDHGNGALALVEAVAVADPPATFAARLSRVAGRGLVPADGGFLLPLAKGAVRVLSPDAFRRLWPGAAPLPHLPRLAALVLRGKAPASLRFAGLELRILGPDSQAPG
jgi:Glyoxalase-like domain